MLPADTKLISVDDHIVEPPHTWTSRLPQRYQEAGPHVVELDNGRQAWRYEGRTIPIELGMVRTLPEVGQDVLDGHVRFDEMRPGCYDPVARLGDMATDGVWAQVAFPTFSRFSGHRFVEGQDKQLSLLATKAYNDFLFEEWCAAAPDRLLPMVALPVWDVVEAVAEVQRTAALGAKAVAFTENPYKLGLPSLHTDHWEPLWAAIDEAGLPICIHIGSSGSLISSSPDAPWAVTLSLNGLNSMVTCVDWLSSGIFERHPGLRLVLSEGGAGWVPYILERAEKEFAIQGARAGTLRNPREIFAEHVYACMVTDYVAIKNIDDIGADRVMWESDYPHNDGMWPESRTTLEKALVDVPDETARKIGELNARRVFDLPA
jgi:predicted TIM-barrel fold metal-dependent hydrolase